MRLCVVLLSLFIILVEGCQTRRPQVPSGKVNWEKYEVDFPLADSLNYGSSYLSIYSQIYDRSVRMTYDMTATASLKNISSSDTVYILKADYYDTHGSLIFEYLDQPIFLKPLETIEIVIDESDKTGGTGANFIFEWATRDPLNEPLFEAVMVSSRQQGISFTSQGVRRN